MSERRPRARFDAIVSVLFVIATASAYSPVHAADKSAYDSARELADKIGAATKGAAGAPKSAAADTGDALPKGDPCTLLTDGEVRTYFPKASAAQRERTREKYGIVACLWDHPAGRLGAQVTLGAKPGSSAEEARGISVGFVDPFKLGAGKSIRYEKITGVGDEAVAVVEKSDEKQGIVSDVAYLYTQRGDRQLMIMATDLARGDRATALKTLQELGRAAAARL